MSRYCDALVWIDRHEAKIFQVTAADASKLVLHPDPHVPNSHRELHSPAGVASTENAGFFGRVAAALELPHGTLVTGPGNIKFELKDYLDLHHASVAERILGVESLDPRSDEDFIAAARRYFETRGHRHRAEARLDTLRVRE